MILVFVASSNIKLIEPNYIWLDRVLLVWYDDKSGLYVTQRVVFLNRETEACVCMYVSITATHWDLFAHEYIKEVSQYWLIVRRLNQHSIMEFETKEINNHMPTK